MRAALAEAGREMLARSRAILRGPGAARAPDRLLFAPQDLHGADAALARDMAEGRWALGDRAVESGGFSPFSMEAPSRPWAEELYGFGWLRHLRVADTAESHTLARALVGEAVGPRRRVLESDLARRPAVAARRVIAFLTHSPLVLSGADHVLYRRYLRRLGRDVGALGRAARDAALPTDRLAAAIGLCVAGLSCAGYEGRLRRGTRLLSAELDAQILGDGGHLGRNPSVLLDLLLDLLPLRLLYATRAIATPEALDRAIERMMPMLRFFRHGSGELALFNGMGPTPMGELASVLSQDRTRGAPRQHAVPSGYDRMAAGGTIVIVETGAAPPLRAARDAHAGCLSFEMSSGQHRLVVNCGSPGLPGPAREAARATRAHSTLSLADASSGHPLGSREHGWAARLVASRFGPVLVGGPRQVGAERGLSGERDQLLSGHHDGYAGGFGATHLRRLRLSPDGGELEGEDSLAFQSAAPEGAAAAVLRFHLHPAVRAETEEESGIVVMTLPDGVRWRFGAEGARPRLEPSVLFAVTEGRRPTLQIVVGLDVPAGTRRVSRRWLFLRA